MSDTSFQRMALKILLSKLFDGAEACVSGVVQITESHSTPQGVMPGSDGKKGRNKDAGKAMSSA